jgi:hypothetical protein
LELLGKLYPEMEWLAVIFKDNLLTLEDFMVINRILIGCTKVVYGAEIHFYEEKIGIFNPSLKKHAAESLYGILKNEYKNTHFSQTQLQKKFHGDVRNIDRSDLFNVLTQYRNIHVLTKEKNLKRPRGKPSTEDSKLTHRNSIYSSDPYFISLNETLDKMPVRVLLYGYLFESYILRRYSDVCHYAKLRQLKVLGAYKMIYNIKRSGISAEKDLEALHLKLNQRYKELIKLDDKELIEISRRQTEVVFELNKPDPWNKVWCKEFFLSGGLSYYQPYEPELILDSI